MKVTRAPLFVRIYGVKVVEHDAIERWFSGSAT